LMAVISPFALYLIKRAQYKLTYYDNIIYGS
jgi:multisubunit Na+/H+ antiporter MnhG subunit